jgi:hypothetical protein
MFSISKLNCVFHIIQFYNYHLYSLSQLPFLTL